MLISWWNNGLYYICLHVYLVFCWLRSVIAKLDNDTLLLVFGDHGMTKTGDHGGDSWDETQAGLFIYSATKSFHSLKVCMLSVHKNSFTAFKLLRYSYTVTVKTTDTCTS